MCSGNEPSWSVDLTQRGVARFSMPDEGSAEFWGSETRLAHLGESVWRGAPSGAGAGADLVVFLRDGACSDTMSDIVHPVNARVSLPGGRFLAGCCRIPAAAAAGTSAVAGAAATVPLEGRVWRVDTLPGQSPGVVASARPPLSIRFENGRADGFSGCNRFAGSYTLAADRVTFGPLAGTMMACGEPDTSLENAFRKVLAGPLTYAIAEGRLTLTSASGATATLVEAPPPSLEGVTWEVTGFNNGREAVVSPKVDTHLTLAFAGGTLSGSAGCNSFHGTYTAEAGRITIGPLASTRMMCGEEGVMEQESQFLAALQAAKVWTVRDDMLDMHFEGGETRALTARPQ